MPVSVHHLCIGRYSVFQGDGPSSIMSEVLSLWEKIAVKAIAAKGHFCAALSGGRTPAELYRFLAEHLDAALWAKTHIFLVDERLVTGDHPDSNFRFINENLVARILSAKPRVHQATAEYERTLKDFFGPRPPVFDLIVLGIGEDGHTASLFPGDGALKVMDRWTAEVKRPDHRRITLTLPVINGAEHIFFVVLGGSKRAVLQKFLAGTEGLPAVLIHPAHGQVEVFTDIQKTERI